MSPLNSITLNLKTAEDEFGKFKTWLDANKRFAERDVVRELKRYPHLSCLMGYLKDGLGRPDVYKYEFEIQGVFRADLVVGNLNSCNFVLVEFEGGQDNSIFGPSQTNQMKDWSKQINHGFSQIVDWSWAKNDNHHTQVFKNAFGCNAVGELYILVCGRRDSLDAVESSRLRWRSDNTLIGGSKVLCMTYDDLIAHFEGTLALWRTS